MKRIIPTHREDGNQGGNDPSHRNREERQKRGNPPIVAASSAGRLPRLRLAISTILRLAPSCLPVKRESLSLLADIARERMRPKQSPC